MIFNHIKPNEGSCQNELFRMTQIFFELGPYNFNLIFFGFFSPTRLSPYKDMG
jgi:hypothetical protein